MFWTKRLAAPVVAAAWLGSVLSGCAEAPEPKPRYEDRTLGTELYLILCEHLSGTYFPNDVQGFNAEMVCHQNAPAPAEAPRLEALRANRTRLVEALDVLLAEDAYADDELGGFVKSLLPLFDKPDEVMPHATRAMALVMNAVKDDAEALAALERISARQGYRPLKNALGSMSAVFRYPRLKEFLLSFTSAVQEGGAARDSFQQLMDAVGMELAVYEPVPAGEIGSLDVARDLFMRSDDNFSSGKAALLAMRDARGYVTPAADSTMGFVDMDDDGYTDIDDYGRFVSSADKPLQVPTPFSVLAEIEGRAKAKRSPEGLALDEAGKPIYEYFDADRTLIAGMSSEIKRWATPDEEGNSTLLGFMKGLPLVMGEAGKLDASFGKGKLTYDGHVMDAAPLMQVFDFASLFIEAPELEDTLTLFDRFLTEHEDVAARFAKALLAAKERADQDANAHIDHPSNFWDEVLTLMRRLNQRQLVPSAENPDADETALESLMRSMADPAIRHMGGQIAMMGRHNVVCSDGDGSDGGDVGQGTGQNLRYCIDINGSDINAPVAGHYGARTDFTKPDLPSDMFATDPAQRVQGNTSQLQAFLMLVGELMDRPLCNKATSGTELFRAMASDSCDDYPLKGFIGLSAPLIGAILGDIPECGFIKVPDMGRAFGQAMMNGTGDPEKEKYGLDLLAYINNDTLNALLDVGGSVGITLDSMRGLFDNIFTACSGVSTFTTHPTGGALARVLFAPEGSKTQIFGDSMFPPATLRPYVAGIPRDFDPMDGQDDFDINNPPPDKKLATFFQGSLPVWEIQWQFGDSEPAGLVDSIVPMMYALNKHDFFPPVTAKLTGRSEDEIRAEGAPYFDSEQYLFNPLVGAFALHFPSKMSGYQSEDPNKPLFSYMSNLTSYQHILVDMLAEPDIKPNEYLSQEQVDWWNAQPNIGMFVALNDFLVVLDEMEFEDGRDGIDVFAALAKRLLNPHVYCAPDDRGYVDADGKGACDCDRDGDGTVDEGAPAGCSAIALRKALTYRASNGQDFVQWELGEKFDGSDADHPWRPVAPIDLLLKALSDFDVQFDANEDVKKAWRAARSEMIDTLFETDGSIFTNPRTVPLMRAMVAWGKEQVARHRVAPDADSSEQDGVRAWAATLPGRTQVFMESPVMASALALMEDLQKDSKLNAEMNQFLAHVFDARTADEDFRTMILSIVDLLQLLRDGENLPPIMRAVSSAMVPNVRSVLEKGEGITKEDTPVDATLAFLHAALQSEGASTLAVILERMVTPDEGHRQGKVAPLETILDVLSEVHRATPGAGTPLNAADIKVLLTEVSDFIEDDKRGMERVYQLMQNRFATPVQE